MNTGYGVIGTNSYGGWAGLFQGNVYISGSLVVGGSYPKSAAVPHPDGTHRLVYCIESPENWFEDVGQAALTGGKATISLDPDFAATVLTANYHVFLTPYGDSNGLYVTNKSATGFVVREQHGGTSSLAFSWKVMAKRKDVTGERLARIEPPPHVPPVQPPKLAQEFVPQGATLPSFPALPANAPAPPAANPSVPANPSALPPDAQATNTPTNTPTSTPTPAPTSTPTTAPTGTATGTRGTPTAASTSITASTATSTPNDTSTPAPTSTKPGTSTGTSTTPNAAPSVRP
jgi:hypothetical protein